MNPRFERAQKKASRLRMAICGPAGAGKTFSALAILSRLGGRVALIDTERGSSRKFADLFEFDVLDLASQSPDDYRAAIEHAVADGYDALAIDSLSHGWVGRNGVLELVDLERAKGNAHSAWRTVKPAHGRLLDAICAAPLHIVATMRTKTEWVQDEADGVRGFRRVGTVPVQREDIEFEFDVVGDMEPTQNRLVVTKTRCPAIAGLAIEKPGAEIADALAQWLKGNKEQVDFALDAIMGARSLDELAAAVELARACDERDRERIKPIYAARRDRLQFLALPPEPGPENITTDDGRQPLPPGQRVASP